MMEGGSDEESPSVPYRSTHSPSNMKPGRQPNALLTGASVDFDDSPQIVVVENQDQKFTGSIRSRQGRDGRRESVRDGYQSVTNITDGDFENSCVFVAENSIEAKKISNNFMFGMRKWKSHLTSRPIGTRSEIVQNLYSDMNDFKEVKVSTVRPFNILYTVLFGWWLALVYVLLGIVMAVTIVGFPYCKFCWRLAGYFFWPFGKFVHRIHHKDCTVMSFYNTSRSSSQGSSKGHGSSEGHGSSGEQDPLMGSMSSSSSQAGCCFGFWTRPSTYVWILLGLPILMPLHALVWAVSWFFVISIPTAKLNSKTMSKILFLPPDDVYLGQSGKSPDELSGPVRGPVSEIVLYSHQSVNIYYYKYAVDGVNVILVNLLIFPVIAIIIGYAVDESMIDPTTKCILAVLAIIPLTYYIGAAISSISAQSSFAVGAILNATFGSMVEVILFVIMLKKGKDEDQECYQELVKSSLTGAILCSILLVPGMSMVIGGLKYRTQRFNPRSASISASLLFVAIVGVFAPTIFSKIFGSLKCTGCENMLNEIPILPDGKTTLTPFVLDDQKGFICQSCVASLHGIHGDQSLYKQHIRPLVYAVCIIMPLAYIIGIIFSLKTHSSHVYGEFDRKMKEENLEAGRGHGTAQWSRLKSTLILLMCAVAIALCSDLVAENIQPLLENSGVSEYFIGVTMLSLVAELPEVVNGVQFALQNNVNLGIEIGCSTAIQVCLVQIPLLVLINELYPMQFYVVFNDVHLWAVIFSVVIINYIFQDGKSDYFQGSIVIFIYILLMCMYFFMLTPEKALCKSGSSLPPVPYNSTTPALIPP